MEEAVTPACDSLEEELLERKIIIYAKASCRQLCADIYESFPREIRDMIYGYLIPGGKRVHGYEYRSAIKKDTGSNVKPKLPFLHEDYLGPAIAAELAIHCYRNLIFTFSRPYYDSGLSDFPQWMMQTDRHDITRRENILHVQRSVNFRDTLPTDRLFRSLLDYLKPGATVICRLLVPECALITVEDCAVAWIRRTSTSLAPLIEKAYRVKVVPAFEKRNPDHYVYVKTLPMKKKDYDRAKVLMCPSPDGEAIDGLKEVLQFLDYPLNTDTEDQWWDEWGRDENFEAMD